MEDIKQGIEKLIDKELERANTLHPGFVDYHQAYAVIKEEYEEMVYELFHAIDNLNEFWDCVKDDNEKGAVKMLNEMEIYSKLATYEFIQFIAMIKKAKKISER